MNLAAGLLALALIGTDASRGPSGVPIHYQVRVLEFDGPAWRGASHAALTPVARAGGTAVWTAPHDLVDRLQATARRTLGTPSLTALEATEATVHTGTDRAYIADLKRRADGAVGHATALAYTPEIGHIEDGVALTVQGRWIDQGLLTKVRVDDQRLLGLITYNLAEQVQPSKPGHEPAEVIAQIQAPEVVTGRVEGEWLIPHDGLLIVSLGVSRTGGEAKPDAMTERIVVVEAARASSEPVAPVPPGPTAGVALPPLPIAASRLPMPTTAAALPAPARPAIARTVVSAAATTRSAPATAPALPSRATSRSTAAMPANGAAMPSVPDRTLPVAVTAEGEVVQPELPPAEAEPVDVSAEPRATPQYRSKSTPAPPPPDVDEPASSPTPGRDALATRTAGPKAAASRPTTLNLSGVTGTAPAAADDCCHHGDSPATTPALLDQVVAAVTQYAHTCEGETEPVCIFEFQGQGNSGRVRVLIDADPAGRALLHRTAAPASDRDPAARKTSHAASAPTPKHCCPASDAAKACPEDEAAPCEGKGAPQSAVTPLHGEGPASVQGLSLQLGGRPDGPNRVEGRLSFSFRVHRNSTEETTDLAACPTATVSPARDEIETRTDALKPACHTGEGASRLVLVPTQVLASPTVLATAGTRDPAVQPTSTAVTLPTRRLVFGLTPVPVAPQFSADPLIIRVPVGLHGVVEINRVGDEPSAGLHRLLGTIW